MRKSMGYTLVGCNSKILSRPTSKEKINLISDGEIARCVASTRLTKSHLHIAVTDE